MLGHQPVRAALGHMMLRHQRSHRPRQLVGERGTGGGAGEADLGVERERRDLPAAAQQRADLANDPRGHGDEIARGQRVSGARRIARGCRTERAPGDTT